MSDDNRYPDPAGFACPAPLSRYPNVLLGHGSGGKLMHELLEHMILPRLNGHASIPAHDAAVFELNGTRMAFTTDSFVVRPLFFPGGDIGTLSVNGTVNDLAMAGARPLYLSVSFIIEEGLPMETLDRVVRSIASAAAESGVTCVTGDTKVVDKGKGDGIFVTTAGIGVLETDLRISPAEVKPGDAVLINGDVGRHGMTVMAEREGLRFETALRSDSAPLHTITADMLKAGIRLHCMRDLTRGGLANALVEIAKSSGLDIEIDEAAVPVANEVRGACELLGLDPLHVACEGRFAAFLDANDKDRALDVMRRNAHGKESVCIGFVGREREGLVTALNAIGTRRIIDMLSGDQLPRIC